MIKKCQREKGKNTHLDVEQDSSFNEERELRRLNVIGRNLLPQVSLQASLSF